MGCNCGKTPMPPTGKPPVVQTGEWVVTYPSGRTEVFRGARAKQKAQREAIATGGKARQGPG